VNRLLFVTGLLFVLVACRGPLSKPVASDKQPDRQMNINSMQGMTHVADVKVGREEIKVEPAKGGITIADLYLNKNNYSGKTVRVRGKITKINPGIMGKNWIHIQDGTESEGQFDLTATTLLEFQTGTVVTIEGKIALDKDFGYGYTYKVLMEDCKIIK
jgi:hypothetical protein